MSPAPRRPALAAAPLVLLVAQALLLAPRAAADCLDCHEGAVSPEGLLASAHGVPPEKRKGASATSLCPSCHGEIAATEEGHAKPPKVECGRCHASSKSQLATSAHAKALAEEGAPSPCVSCHGTHEIKKLASTSLSERRALEKRTCGRCHPKSFADYERSNHGRSQNSSVATCVDCHGGHAILSRSDPAASTYRLRQAEICTSCHTNPKRGFTKKQRAKVADYFSSAHGVALRRSGLLLTATCVDCHGSHSILQAASRQSNVARSHIPQTCGKCHAGVLAVYRESVHGKPFAEGNTDVPVCTDCHESHQIRSHWDPKSTVYATNVSTTCLRCHSNAKFINRYNFPSLREETYLESYHGAASKLGDTSVANCGSCHGFHDIRRSDDPRSSVNPENMARTCGKCHKTSDPSKPMAIGKIHLTTARESHFLVDLVRRAYIGIISFTLGLFLVLIAVDLRWHLRGRRR